MYGLRLSLLVSVLASAVSLLIGIAYGALAGFAGGRTDGLMMRGVDVLYSLPYLFIVIILTSLLPRGSLAVLFLALGAVGWLTSARIVRAQTLALRRREFIEAARALGVSPLSILVRHVIPNLLGPVIVYATLTVPQMILFESFLSFLGLGVQEPRASLGSLDRRRRPGDELRPLDAARARDAAGPAAPVPERARRWLARCARSACILSAADEAVLRLTGLGVDFRTPGGTVRAVEELDLAVGAGECLGVVGESGAGKSQAFLAVMGLLEANGAAHGSARFLGRELLNLSPAALDRVRGCGHRHGVPGPHDLAHPAPDGRGADRRGARAPPRRILARRRARRRSRCWSGCI